MSAYRPPATLRPYVYPNDDYWSAIGEMGNRMAFSEQKYGSIDANYPGADALATLNDRLDLYRTTGNVEWLIDVANMAIIERLHPSHPAAHFRATSADESPGIVGLP